MPVQLEIKDGNPQWYLSPDIWLVPYDTVVNSDTSSQDVQELNPKSGEQYFVCAKVHNDGDLAVDNATVNFYWADPSLGFNRETANPIGTAFVSVGPQQANDVLCLNPWMPPYRNEGHICLLAEASHTTLDPLPLVLDFNVERDRHTAQRNLSIIESPDGYFRFTFEIHNPSREIQTFIIRVEQGSTSDAISITEPLGGIFAPQGTEGGLTGAGIVQHPHINVDNDTIGASSAHEEIRLSPYQRVGRTIIGKFDGDKTAFHILQQKGDLIVGGITVFVFLVKE